MRILLIGFGLSCLAYLVVRRTSRQRLDERTTIEMLRALLDE